jgi:hypothetical protein
MSTLRQIVDQTRHDWLMQGQREVIARLSGALSDTTGVIVTLSGQSPVAGMVLTIDSEDIYVIAASGAATTDAIRGYNGTTAATHLNSALVTINQRFTDFRIIRAINDELRSFTAPPNGLFRPRTVTLTPVAGQSGYDLGVSTDFLDVLSVQVRDVTGSITLSWMRDSMWRVERNMPTDDFASGIAIFFRRGVPVDHDVLVTYAATYTAVTSANLAAEISTTTGLQTTAEDILPVGAALRLVPGREVRRNFSDTRPESRPAADVPPGAIARSADGLRILRLQRIAEERARLAGQYESYANVSVVPARW